VGAGGEKGDFGCTESEFEVIRSFAEDSRMFLVKQGQNSAVARLDLGGFDDELAIISGSTDNIELLHRVMAEVGEDPDDWLPVFQERRKARHKPKPGDGVSIRAHVRATQSEKELENV
jgi:type IV secretory pathway VirB4 component